MSVHKRVAQLRLETAGQLAILEGPENCSGPSNDGPSLALALLLAGGMWTASVCISPGGCLDGYDRTHDENNLEVAVGRVRSDHLLCSRSPPSLPGRLPDVVMYLVEVQIH